jgi:hypothetical protein
MKKILLGGAMAGLTTTTAYAFCMLPEDPTSACTMLMGSNDNAFYSCMQMADINYQNAMNQYNECEERELDSQLQLLPPSYAPPAPRYAPPPPPRYSVPPPLPPAPAPTYRIEDVAPQVIINLLSSKSDNAEDYRIFYAAPNVIYYGKLISTDEVLQQTQAYLNRWPQRDNKVTDIKVYCYGNTTCNVTGTFSFQAEGSTRRSVGTANFQYQLTNGGHGYMLISSEEVLGGRQGPA